jgi:uncharacterized protein DUF5679
MVGRASRPEGRRPGFPVHRLPTGRVAPVLATIGGTRHRRDLKEDPVAESYEGYCVKCKEKRTFEGEVSVSDSGRRMAKGTCPVCGTKMNRILGKA